MDKQSDATAIVDGEMAFQLTKWNLNISRIAKQLQFLWQIINCLMIVLEERQIVITVRETKCIRNDQSLELYFHAE